MQIIARLLTDERLDFPLNLILLFLMIVAYRMGIDVLGMEWF